MATKCFPSKQKIVIIGAGACGLGAAWRLQEMGHSNWCVIESSSHVGGQGMSVKDKKGFVWDIGGHVIFSHFQYFTKLVQLLLPETEWLHHRREAWIWMRDRFIPYPVQFNLWRLPKLDLWKCLDGLLYVEKHRSEFKAPKTFHDWLVQGFGQGMMETFLEPYNTKVWAYPTKELNVEWMGKRAIGVDLRQVMINLVFNRESFGWDPTVEFSYPKKSTGCIWEAMYKQLPPENFKFNSEVIAIDVSDSNHKFLTLRSGEEIEFDDLITSMPLNKLFTGCKGLGVPTAQREAMTEPFKYSSTHIVGLGLRGPVPENLFQKGWIYFPEMNCKFYRATVFSNYSPDNVPNNGEFWSLLLEISESEYYPCNSTRDEVIAQTIKGCIATQLLSPIDEIVSTFHHHLEYGYPTPFLNRDKTVTPILDLLEEHGILSRGRFGCWKYEISNQDHTVMMGVEAVNRVLLGSYETCLNMPSLVNMKQDSQTVEMITQTLPYPKNVPIDNNQCTVPVSDLTRSLSAPSTPDTIKDELSKSKSLPKQKAHSFARLFHKLERKSGDKHELASDYVNKV